MNDTVSLATVRTILEAHIAKGYSPGMVGLIGTGDKAEVVVVGEMSWDSPKPLRRDSLFRIASMTKPVTAVATMMLVEEGKLRLDEPVDRLLPELANRRVLKRIDAPLEETVSAARRITVEDLLSFRFGMGILLIPPDQYPIQRKISELQLTGFGPPDPSSPLLPDEWMKRLGTLPLMAQPGEQWMYNTGSCVLSVLIARASGKSFPQFLQECLFEPLGMSDTAFYVPSAKLDRLVDAYNPGAGTRPQLFDPAASSLWKVPPAFPDGAAGLTSTADDFFAFSRFVATGKDRRGRPLLSAQSISLITTNRLTPMQCNGGVPILETERGWGLGMGVVVGATPESFPVGAYGWNGGYGTSWLSDPHSGKTAILLTQTLFTSPAMPRVHQDFWRLVFAVDS